MTDHSHLENIKEASSNSNSNDARERLSGEAIFELASGQSKAQHEKHVAHEHSHKHFANGYREDHYSSNANRAPYDWNNGSGYVLNLMLGYRR